MTDPGWKNRSSELRQIAAAFWVNWFPMVAGGNLDNAFELEDSWNHLLANFPAMLYCMYEQTPFEQLQKLNHFCEVCNRHDAVLRRALAFEHKSRLRGLWCYRSRPSLCATR